MDSKISFKSSVTIIVITILSIVLSVIMGYSALWGILTGIIISAFFGIRNGFKLKEILRMGIKGIKDAYIVLIIMALIGIIIGVWMVMGTIPGLMYYGFRYLSGGNFVLSTFLLSSFMSFILGTSIGTVSTAGIPLVGIGLGLGVPAHITAGAIVSGAFLGDRTSPMSSSANLTAVITKTNLYDNIKYLIKSLIPVFILSVIFYYLVGRSYVIGGDAISSINEIQGLLMKNFSISPLVLIPPLLIIVLSFFRVKIKYNLVVGIFTALIIGLLNQNIAFLELFKASFSGYHPDNGELSRLISGGGFLSMKVILSIVGSSTALYGIFEGTNIISPVIDRFINSIKSVIGLIIKTSLLGILMNLVTLNQTLAIIIPGKSTARLYDEMQLPRSILARTLGDTSTVIAPLIPWNINGLVIAVALGTSVASYAPYAILCYLLPLSTLVFTYVDNAKHKMNQP